MKGRIHALRVRRSHTFVSVPGIHCGPGAGDSVLSEPFPPLQEGNNQKMTPPTVTRLSTVLAITVEPTSSEAIL